MDLASASSATRAPSRAAQYVRMSTEHQQYSPENQLDIPAVIIEARREDQFLMSLVENIARRPPSNRDILREVKSLRERAYGIGDIARKLGMERSYIAGIVHLVDHEEVALIEAVEGGKLPMSVAIEIANGEDREISDALAEAYESGQLRGNKLAAARRLIEKRIEKRQKEGKQRSMKRGIVSSDEGRQFCSNSPFHRLDRMVCAPSGHLCRADTMLASDGFTRNAINERLALMSSFDDSFPPGSPKSDSSCHEILSIHVDIRPKECHPWVGCLPKITPSIVSLCCRARSTCSFCKPLGSALVTAKA